MEKHTVHIVYPDGHRKTIASRDEWPGIRHIAEKLASECARVGWKTETIAVTELGPREWEAVLDKW